MDSSKRMAVIYVRAARRTMSNRDVMYDQERICRAQAEAKGFKVAMCFSDHSSGSGVDRPSLRAMLEFIEQHRADTPAVFVEDHTRLARSIEVFGKLRDEITRRGGTVHIAERIREKHKGHVERDRERD